MQLGVDTIDARRERDKDQEPHDKDESEVALAVDQRE